MAAVPAGEAGRIDSGNRDGIVRRIEDFQCTLKEIVKIDRFDPTDEFLEGGQVRN